MTARIVHIKSCVTWVYTQVGLRGLLRSFSALLPQSNQEFPHQSPCSTAHPKSAHTVSVHTPELLWQGASTICCVCRAQHCPKERHEQGSRSSVCVLVGNSQCARSSWFTAAFINSGAASQSHHIRLGSRAVFYAMLHCQVEANPWGTTEARFPNCVGSPRELQGSLEWVMSAPPLVP